MLDRNGLENLLTALHSDRDQASHSYTALRERLVRFFAWNHSDNPEELADETLDRLACRLSANEEEIREPSRYAAAIARLILQEDWRRKSRREDALSAMMQSHRDSATIERDRAVCEDRALALERCLQELPAPSRRLIQRYYDTESGTQIQQRQTLAKEYGISTNALRNRAMRIRLELEKRFSLGKGNNNLSGGKINRLK